MVSRIGAIRPGERGPVLAAFLTLFGTLTGHALLETARDALFLARLPATRLPWVYLAIALLAVFLSNGPLPRPRGALGRYSLSLVLGFSAVGTFAFWFFSSLAGSPATLYALYVWTGLVATLTTVQFWLVLSESFTVTQAKRLYRLIAVGSVLGAVAGSALARELAGHSSTRSLVVAAALAFAVTALGPALLVRRPEGAYSVRRGLGSFLQDADLMRSQPYVRGLAGLVLLSTIALTLSDFIFKNAVAREVPKEQLGVFIATAYMVFNILALFVQFFVTPILLRTLGLHRALWVLPGLLSLGAAGVALGGGIVAALVLKGADGSLRHSLHRTTTELLYLPIPDALRYRAKPFIDVVGQRGGQAIGSLLILSEVVVGRGDVVLATFVGALAVLWIVLVMDPALRNEYLNLIRTALREGRMQAQDDLPQLDLGSLEALFSALNSRDDAEVMGGMDLLAAQERTRLIPALILYHPSPRVVIRALELFGVAGRQDFLPISERLLEHADAEVRAGALRALTTVRRDEALLRRAVEDPGPIVRATALVGLAAEGPGQAEAKAGIEALLASNLREAHVALARAVRLRPSPLFEDLLLRLGDSADVAVREQTALAMGVLRSPRFLPTLLDMLASHEVRDEARAAFVAYGPEGLEFLEGALADSSLPHELRRHVPRTIASFPPVEASRVLLARLLPEPDGMVRFKILRGLGRLAATHPEVSLDRKVLRDAAERTLRVCLRLVAWRLTLVSGAVQDPGRRTTGHDLLVDLLRDKEAHATERLFRILGLLHRAEDFKSIHRGLRSANPKVRAGSRELIENLLAPPLRDAVLALVDDVPDEERLARAAGFQRVEVSDHDALLAALLDEPGETLRCLVAHHVAELGLHAFRPRLREIERQGTGLFVARVIDRAARILEAREGLARAY
jgi:ATP:ADP antiporter, AAA family